MDADVDASEGRRIAVDPDRGGGEREVTMAAVPREELGTPTIGAGRGSGIGEVGAVVRREEARREAAEALAANACREFGGEAVRRLDVRRSELREREPDTVELGAHRVDALATR